MITLSLLQYIADNGFGTVDKDLFWQKLSIDKDGVFIADLGQAQTRGERRTQRYELYSRGKSDVDGYRRLKAIADFLNGSYETCSLPACPLVPDSESYSNITIMPLSTPTNIGEKNGRIIWSVTGKLVY